MNTILKRFIKFLTYKINHNTCVKNGKKKIIKKIGVVFTIDESSSYQQICLDRPDSTTRGRGATWR